MFIDIEYIDQLDLFGNTKTKRINPNMVYEVNPTKKGCKISLPNNTHYFLKISVQEFEELAEAALIESMPTPTVTEVEDININNNPPVDPADQKTDKKVDDAFVVSVERKDDFEDDEKDSSQFVAGL